MVGDRTKKKTELMRHMCSAEDYLRGIIAMIERDADWWSVVQQIWTVQAVIHKIHGLILNLHLTTCLDKLLTDTDMEPAARERYLAEIMSLYHLLGKVRAPSNWQEETYLET